MTAPPEASLPPDVGHDSQVASILLGVILTLLAAAPLAVARDPELLDGFIRNQHVLVPVFAVIITITIFGLAMARGIPQLSSGIDKHHMSAWRTIRTNPRTVMRPLMLPFTALSSAVLALGLFGSAKPLVPKTAGLEVPVKLRDEAANRDLLLFIHGWNGDAAGTWKQFPALAASDPNLAKYNVWIVDYPTFFVRRNVEIVELGAFFDRYLDDTAKLFGRYDRIVVIAHSMGGLVARDVSIHHHLRKGKRAFTRIIEIATPHAGANPAGLASDIGLTRGFANNMRSGSPYLKGLATYWYALTDKPFTFCIGSPHDRVVPADSAVQQCSDATKYLQGGHTAIVKPVDRNDIYYSVPISQVP